MQLNIAIRDYIKNNGIKQAFLSSKTGISVDTISKIMLCKRKMSAEEFLLICDALCVDPRFFQAKDVIPTI